jgi:hypothetical protein
MDFYQRAEPWGIFTGFNVRRWDKNHFCLDLLALQDIDKVGSILNAHSSGKNLAPYLPLHITTNTIYSTFAMTSGKIVPDRNTERGAHFWSSSDNKIAFKLWRSTISKKGYLRLAMEREKIEQIVHKVKNCLFIMNEIVCDKGKWAYLSSTPCDDSKDRDLPVCCLDFILFFHLKVLAVVHLNKHKIVNKKESIIISDKHMLNSLWTIKN